MTEVFKAVRRPEATHMQGQYMKLAALHRANRSLTNYLVHQVFRTALYQLVIPKPVG